MSRSFMYVFMYVYGNTFNDQVEAGGFWINKGTKRMAFEVESPVALHDWRGR